MNFTFFILFSFLIFSLNSNGEDLIKLNLEVVPSNYSGICPVVLSFEGEIFSKENARVQYRFLRSDKKIMPVEVINIKKNTSRKVKMLWETDKDLKGWASLEVISPVRVLSKKAAFSVECLGIVGPPMKADLTLKFQAPSSAYQGENLKDKYKLLVSNIGNLEAKNFNVDIVLYGWAGSEPPPQDEFLCGRGFVSSLQPSDDGIPSGLFPSIPPDIPPGKYKICALADPTNTVNEIKEDNNKTCQKIEILRRK